MNGMEFVCRMQTYVIGYIIYENISDQLNAWYSTISNHILYQPGKFNVHSEDNNVYVLMHMYRCTQDQLAR